MSRRPDPRFNRGRVASAAGSSSPPWSLIGMAAVLQADGVTPQWHMRADTGIFLDVGVAVASDLTNNGRDFVQPTGTLQPSYLASAVNGQPALVWDGVDDRMVQTFSRVAPGTQPFFVCFVVSQSAWVLNATVWNDGGATIYSSASTPQIRTFNGTNGAVNGGLPADGTYRRIYAQFRNATSDLLKAGSVQTSGTNTGNAASGSSAELGNAPAVNRPLTGGIAEAVLGLGILSAGGITALDSYCSGRYGAGVLT